MQTIIIDKEFKTLIPPLSTEELAGLEESIITYGCRDCLITWGGILVDGHNRYEICTRLKLPYNTIEMCFEDRDDVIGWIIDNQLSRRNITMYDRTRLVLRKEESIQARAKRKEQIRKSTKQETAESPLPTITTREELAKLAGVSHDTVAKVKVIEAKATQEQKADLTAGKKKVGTVYAEIQSKGVKEVKKIEPRIWGRALDFATMAISHLTRIDKKDPNRVAALNEVITYCQKEINT